MGSLEGELKERSTQVETLTAQLEQAEVEKRQLEEQVSSIHVLLEASQSRGEVEDHSQVRPFYTSMTVLYGQSSWTWLDLDHKYLFLQVCYLHFDRQTPQNWNS